LKSGDKGINPLDEAAKEHDIFYSQFDDTAHRHIADKISQNKAWKRVISKDASLAERSAALLTTGAMNVKRTLGMGLCSGKKKKKKCGKKGKGLKLLRAKKRGKEITFNNLVKKARKAIKSKKADSVGTAVNIAMDAVKNNITRVPRIIPISKSGGALSLIPILAGISALGGAASGVSSIVKAIGDIIDAKKRFSSGEKKQIGNGLYLAPYKKNGYGLYLNPSPGKYRIKNLKT